MLQMKCNGSTGHWDSDPSYDYGAMVDEDGVILEHECVGGDPKPTLVITIEQMGAGAQLTCETPDTDSIYRIQLRLLTSVFFSVISTWA